MTIPASIRYNNPGAMWGGNSISKKWGETDNIALNDGLHQNNHIAVFPDVVHGAAAQFDLWDHNYKNMTLAAAITKWSGGNWSASYMSFLCKATGLTQKTVITHEVLASETGWKLMKAQAQWEAGKLYPMTDDQWKQAQAMVFVTDKLPVHGARPIAPEPKPSPSITSKVWSWLRDH